MIFGLNGKLVDKKPAFIVIDVGGIYYKVAIPPAIPLPPLGDEIKLFTYLAVKENALELYGFSEEIDLVFFEKLLSISGVGPKSALATMAIAPTRQLMATVNEGKSELLTRVSGIGKKTAERITLELKNKLPQINSEQTMKEMELDKELSETLSALGYTQAEVRRAVSSVKNKDGKLEDRLREALKNAK